MKTLKLGTQTGSFFNHVMSNNTATPDPEKGATELHWTDRTAYFVNWVSADKKSCIIEQAKAVRIDGLGMSDSQSYQYERDNNPEMKLVFKWGSWKVQHIDKHSQKKTYAKINIAFGYMQEYYDFSF